MAAQEISRMLGKADKLAGQGQAAAAARLYEAITAAEPGNAKTWTALGNVRVMLGQLEQAAAAFNTALQIDPDHGDSHYGLGFIAYTRHNYPESESRFRRVLQLNPGNAQAHNALATSLQALGRQREALDHYDRALQLVPVYADAHFGRGGVLIALGDTDGAIGSLREAIRLAPRHADARVSLASALMTHGRHSEALAACEAALQINPQLADAVALAATIEQHAGRAEAALARLQPWLDKDSGNVNLAIAFAEVSKTLDRPGAAIGRLERLLAGEQPLPATSRRNLHFNLGRLYDRTGRYDEAFDHYRQGNRLRPLEYDPAANTREIDAIIAVHNAAFMAAAPRAALATDRPVFVVGMPRSGTSLVEQILASHPRVFGAGELPDIWQVVARLPALLGSAQAYPRCLSLLDRDRLNELAGQYLEHLATLAPDADRVVDKMPGNFRYLGLIELLFPGARVIHCTRDPLDTCLSCYFQDFSRSHAYSYDLAQLGAYYRDYRRLMAHWKSVLSLPVLDVSYEALVAEQETVSRSLVEFIGLEWDARCLDFHESGRFVATASYDQVRRPLYRRSIARWRHYEKHLGPLIAALGEP